MCVKRCYYLFKMMFLRENGGFEKNCLLRLLNMDLILVRQLKITLELNGLILNGL